MQYYNVYIEYTDNTYQNITVFAESEKQINQHAIRHAEIQDKEIYFIEPELMENV